jgi:hypothetical protein
VEDQDDKGCLLGGSVWRDWENAHVFPTFFLQLVIVVDKLFFLPVRFLCSMEAPVDSLGHMKLGKAVFEPVGLTGEGISSKRLKRLLCLEKTRPFEGQLPSKRWHSFQVVIHV